ncbi:hypothetical protein GCM10027271_23890 [Saccharopolyspora gloriosae]|uniref:Uncharacterized protein n=1 Tax=Saccharopolyspora gloriosae TaxID=455344 RepID=A0A840NS64_9PSEU|nr:hypothetical protein [Saccharopolyspora gloriosae]MBB5071057.1 hypothetical protein [Saccharopolyspora gloriosae]
MTAWVSSEWCSTWHVVDRAAAGPVLVGACGHPISGRVHRLLDRPRRGDEDRRECASCVALLAP